MNQVGVAPGAMKTLGQHVSRSTRCRSSLSGRPAILSCYDIPDKKGVKCIRRQATQDKRNNNSSVEPLVQLQRATAAT
ncbi:hypothetical protein E2C01_064783 [Portunus trituberculatus]|uniref:Uncharacterized protein n=1 Tax=Portunus trituberculatus TaxID=210409 RepID=A0A5B7HH23_PORTR|nr:hypothetical protein [Portunus trituberculatus]